ncbi:MAG: riboflavin biosynthesis protein RibD, partial [Polaromonas sp.]|nr:riboflavin biosynthesis protein RibD [Polaromonas sp.]
MASDTETDAMRRALVLAREHPHRTYPNPRVGCVLLAPDGTLVAEGAHRGAGTPHAEAVALAAAG